MESAQAKRIVLLGTIGSGILAAVGSVDLTHDKGALLPSTRIPFGVFLTGALLAGAAEFAPDIAAGIASLMLVTTMFVIGAPAWSRLTVSPSGKPAGITPITSGE